MEDIDLMKEALELAQRAADIDEVPIGAIIEYNGKIIGRGFNRTRSLHDPTSHAEMEAIREAGKSMGNERLTGARLFVTKEPCAMCAGAIVHARIAEVIIATKDIRYGACGTVFQVCGNKKMNHRPEIKFGLLEEESINLLQNFFQAKRKKQMPKFPLPK